MKAKLDGIYSPDLPSGYDEMPENPKDCWVIIHADIGVEGGQGMDCFTMYVTTPEFLSKSVRNDRYQLGRGLLILHEFDWELVEQAINSVCSEIEADSWVDMENKLSKSFFYEYE